MGELYYKFWSETEKPLSKDGIITNARHLYPITRADSYPETYCWEIWGINKVKDNEEGFFDFNKNLIDIGAGLGEYCWLTDFKHAYAFEPNKETLYLMHTNIVLHERINQITTFNTLLSNKKENINFDGFFTEGSIEQYYNADASRQIETRTLDEFGIENVGLIKIDVEGMEEKVLRGGIGTIIRNNYPPILFECWDVEYNGMTQEKHDSLFNFLKSLGYEIFEYWCDIETHLAIHKNQLNK